MPETLTDAETPRPAETSLRHLFQRAARNAAWLFSAQTLMRLVSFAVGTVLARSLGAGDFGRYTFIFTYTLYFAFLADAGLGRLLIREGARSPATIPDLFARVASLRLALALGGYLLLLGSLPLVGADRELALLTAVAGLNLFTGALGGALNSLFQAREQMRVSAAFQTLSTLGTAVASLGALLLGLGLPGIVGGIALANLPPLLYLLHQWRRGGGSLRLAFDLTFWRWALHRSAPFAVLGLIGLVYFRADALLLTWLKGAEATGVYTAAYRLLDAVTDIPGVVVVALFPTLARLHVESRAQLRRAYLGALGALTLTGVPVMLGMLLLARPAIELLYGTEYAGSVPVLQLLAVAVFLIFIDTANTMVLYAGEDLRPVVRLSLVTMTANIALNLALIPRFGERGAALAMILSTALSIAIFTPVVFRSLRNP